MASVDADFAAKLSVAPALFSPRLLHSRGKMRASLDQVSMGREITGPHAVLDVVQILFPPSLVPRASLACCTPFSALPLGSVMACQMTFAWIVAAIAAATALPCPRRAGSWQPGVLNVFQWALLCLHSSPAECSREE
jgi:hypothetical protein